MKPCSATGYHSIAVHCAAIRHEAEVAKTRDAQKNLPPIPATSADERYINWRNSCRLACLGLAVFALGLLDKLILVGFLGASGVGGLIALVGGAALLLLAAHGIIQAIRAGRDAKMHARRKVEEVHPDPAPSAYWEGFDPQKVIDFYNTYKKRPSPASQDEDELRRCGLDPEDPDHPHVFAQMWIHLKELQEHQKDKIRPIFDLFRLLKKTTHPQRSVKQTLDQNWNVPSSSDQESSVETHSPIRPREAIEELVKTCSEASLPSDAELIQGLPRWAKADADVVAELIQWSPYGMSLAADRENFVELIEGAKEKHGLTAILDAMLEIEQSAKTEESPMHTWFTSLQQGELLTYLEKKQDWQVHCTEKFLYALLHAYQVRWPTLDQDQQRSEKAALNKLIDIKQPSNSLLNKRLEDLSKAPQPPEEVQSLRNLALLWIVKRNQGVT